METVKPNYAGYREYVATKDFYLSELNLAINLGNSLHYKPGRLIYEQETYNVQHIEPTIRQGWLVLADGENPDPAVQRNIDRNLHTRKKHVPATAKKSSKVEMVGGIETLPSDWDTLHWTKKRAYIKEMTDVELLEDMREDEQDKMKAIIDRRIEEIGKASEAKVTVTIGGETGTPPKLAPLPRDVAEDEFFPTDFGEEPTTISMFDNFSPTVMADTNEIVAQIVDPPSRL